MTEIDKRIEKKQTTPYQVIGARFFLMAKTL